MSQDGFWSGSSLLQFFFISSLALFLKQLLSYAASKLTGLGAMRLWRLPVWVFLLLPKPLVFFQCSPNLRVHAVWPCSIFPLLGPGVWNQHLHCPEEPGAKHRVHRHLGACLPWDGGEVPIKKRENKWVEMGLFSKSKENCVFFTTWPLLS